ncbi:retropepsin-like aspartic protease [Paenibacillus radicis (ex Xue et al. 2023)]|uniref:Retropepsin-like domain-containing protein n=1 Tax=Paenibacillus radicis (ex Xue et al. 2023) TaxID=2972489 RepID=A0ABT1YRM5_9BACL|nr:retropepsin-like aspartic protease [Paenibacillus radicis (ex Xue et al. 2023)]MCR8635821.1 retropepsin-like domain-containing protein [Paenibacillus radicis (ex Xue et al. 2023)]
MNINVEHGLPFVSVTVIYNGNELFLSKVLLDTGSAGTLFNADLVRDIGVIPEGNDAVDSIRGVGGIEYVYTKSLDAIHFGNFSIELFPVQIGSMDYGIDIDGIIGFDFMEAAGIVIDTKLMIVKSND